MIVFHILHGIAVFFIAMLLMSLIPITQWVTAPIAIAIAIVYIFGVYYKYTELK